MFSERSKVPGLLALLVTLWLGPFFTAPMLTAEGLYWFSVFAPSQLPPHLLLWDQDLSLTCTFKTGIIWICSTLWNECMQIILFCKWFKFCYSDFNFINSFLGNTDWTRFTYTAEKRGKTLIYRTAIESLVRVRKTSCSIPNNRALS